MPFLNFNPWVILGVILALFIFGGTCYETGHKNGVNSQKVADQQAIDAVNAKIAENKKQANAILRKADADIIALQQQRDAAKTKLQQEHQTNVETTNKLRDAYSAYGLRFAAAEGGRSGDGCPGQLPPAADPAGHPAAPSCQLSDQATKSLRALAYDADTLKDDYTLLYNWAHGIKAP